MKSLLCPDIQFLENYLLLENEYNSKKDRKSFELLINKCSNDLNLNCASDKDIDILLDNIFFTVNFVKSDVNFKKEINQDPFET